jgi:hypothetical protein
MEIKDGGRDFFILERLSIIFNRTKLINLFCFLFQAWVYGGGRTKGYHHGKGYADWIYKDLERSPWHE